MRVQFLSPDEWMKVSKEAHLLCFGEVRDPSLDRISFALLNVEDETPVSYMTCRELDGETVYLQYGGAFPEAKGTTKSYRSYLLDLNQLKEMGFKYAGTFIENTNIPMLKFAMKAGWLITGIRTFKGSVLVEHQLNLSDMEV